MFVKLSHPYLKMQSSSSLSSSIQLPQPSCSEPYQYILHEDVASTLFPPPLAVGTLCFITHGTTAYFRRARVVEDEGTASNYSDNDRILIRYPSGSTYRVRRNKVHPTLEEHANENHNNNNNNNNQQQSRRRRFVLIYPETPIYRQACVTHTYWEDSFLEIGCDGGNTVERVHRGLQEGGFVSMDPCTIIEPGKLLLSSSSTTTTGKYYGGIQCLGIDKSQFSIDTATEAYPQCSFSLQDALEDNACSLRQYCHETLLHGYPTVVAIDINGNREIPAVVQCIENIMNPIDPPEGWELPRLIIVKARRLHHAVLERRASHQSVHNGAVIDGTLDGEDDLRPR